MNDQGKDHGVGGMASSQNPTLVEPRGDPCPANDGAAFREAAYAAIDFAKYPRGVMATGETLRDRARRLAEVALGIEVAS